jgi:hypothetical protein
MAVIMKTCRRAFARWRVFQRLSLFSRSRFITMNPLQTMLVATGVAGGAKYLQDHFATRELAASAAR